MRDVLRVAKCGATVIDSFTGYPIKLHSAGTALPREVLGTMMEVLRDRHERLCCSVTGVVQRLLLCFMSLHGFMAKARRHDGGSMIPLALHNDAVWACASAHVAQRCIQQLSHCSCGGWGREIEMAQHQLDQLAQPEDRLRVAMTAVRAMRTEQIPPVGVDPLQDAEFMGSLHGRTWQARHGPTYLSSFSQTANAVLEAIVHSVTPPEQAADLTSLLPAGEWTCQSWRCRLRPRRWWG